MFFSNWSFAVELVSEILVGNQVYLFVCGSLLSRGSIQSYSSNQTLSVQSFVYICRWIVPSITVIDWRALYCSERS